MVVHIPIPLGRFPMVAVLEAILLLLLLLLLRLKRDSELLKFKPERASWKNRNPHQPSGDTPGGPHTPQLLQVSESRLSSAGGPV